MGKLVIAVTSLFAMLGALLGASAALSDLFGFQEFLASLTFMNPAADV